MNNNKDNILISYKDKIFNNNQNNINIKNKVSIDNKNNSDNINNKTIYTKSAEMQMPKKTRMLKLEKVDISVIIQALRDNGGLIGQSAAALGVDRASLSKFIKRFPSPELTEAIFHSRENFIDKCEERLERHVESNDPRISLDAVKFALSTIGKERGYTTSSNIEIDANISAVAPDIAKIAEAAKKLDDIIEIEISEE